MNYYAIKERVYKVLEDMDFNRNLVHTQNHLKNDMGFSSFDLICFYYALEIEFDVNLSDKELKQIKTVGDAVDLICNKVANAKPVMVFA